MSNRVNIACLQTRPAPTMEAALDEILPMAGDAVSGGAELIFLPEYCGGFASEGVRLCPPSAPEAKHPVLAALRDFAAQHGIWVNVGSIAIDGPDGRILNRGYMIDGGGAVTGHYDKIHLFDVDLADGAVFRESETVAPGSQLVIHSTPHCSIGHTICYDLRFPGLYRDLAMAGAEVLCCPAAFARMTGEAHWHILNRARAIENSRYVVSACAVGPVPGGGEAYGHSLIISPWGEVIADGGSKPGIVHAHIDIDEVGKSEARVASLHSARKYSGVSQLRQAVA